MKKRIVYEGVDELKHLGTPKLDDQFLSVCTHEQNMNVPDKGLSPFSNIPNINTSRAGVEKQLLSLNPTKFCGSDDLSPKLLKTVAL